MRIIKLIMGLNISKLHRGPMKDVVVEVSVLISATLGSLVGTKSMAHEVFAFHPHWSADTTGGSSTGGGDL